jgi:S-adenosylmethionine:tRNA ribosyltransferase-isomerase
MRAKSEGARVLAVGTTSVRALESAAATKQLSGPTDLFIRPGFEWKVVDRLMTNFHLPKSSLLVMLAAFMGDRWREVYAAAAEEGYRFLSFGDAMLVERA